MRCVLSVRGGDAVAAGPARLTHVCHSRSCSRSRRQSQRGDVPNNPTRAWYRKYRSMCRCLGITRPRHALPSGAMLYREPPLRLTALSCTESPGRWAELPGYLSMASRVCGDGHVMGVCGACMPFDPAIQEVAPSPSVRFWDTHAGFG